MKIYKELYIKGNVQRFIRKINCREGENWQIESNKKDDQYISFRYIGAKLEPSDVFVYCGDIEKKQELQVVNIVPINKDELTIQEYNEILDQFYVDIVKPYKDTTDDVVIIGPTNDIFDPLSIMTQEELDKLELFCNVANKTTGSRHPLDQERWFDFICLTVKNNNIIDSSILTGFLQDESYWGKKPEEYLGAIGSYAWSEHFALELSNEYEQLTSILNYYKKNYE